MVERTSTGSAPCTLVETNDNNYARIKILRTLWGVYAGPPLMEAAPQPEWRRVHTIARGKWACLRISTAQRPHLRAHIALPSVARVTFRMGLSFI